MTQNRIFLIGMSRAGKTALGKNLAESLDMDFFDTDLEVKQKTDMEISEAYLKLGEKKFRELEFEALKAFADSSNSIIATGGGVIENVLSYEFLRRESQKYISLKKSVKLIFIDTDPEIIFNRIEDAYSRGRAYPKFLGDVKNSDEAKTEFYKVYNRRKNMYAALANIHFKCEYSIEEACKQLKNIILSDTMQ